MYLKMFYLQFVPCVFQALRYPYFHVGQTLGVPLKCSEQHKARAKMSEAATEPKPLSLCKIDLDSGEPNKAQAELQTSSQAQHQPLREIPLPQDNMEPSTRLAMAGQQEPLSLVKNKQPMSWHAVGITQVKPLNVIMGTFHAL